MIRNVRYSTSVQSFYLCCHSGWVDVPDCGWNCQLAVGDNGPIPCSLVIIVGYLLGNDVAGRCAGGSPNSICFFSSDEWRVGPILWKCSRANKMSDRFSGGSDEGRPAMNTNAAVKVTTHVGQDLLQSARLFRHEHAVVWEYVSNGLQYKDAGTRPTVVVNIDIKSKKISIRDNGRGMPLADLQRYFQMHGENLDRKQGRPGRGYYRWMCASPLRPFGFVRCSLDSHRCGDACFCATDCFSFVAAALRDR
jgi:Histidine kinase-, DNA gyrase B-, and HSP90-like ATPase